MLIWLYRKTNGLWSHQFIHSALRTVTDRFLRNLSIHSYLWTTEPQISLNTAKLESACPCRLNMQLSAQELPRFAL
jgi:hypothetical protein